MKKQPRWKRSWLAICIGTGVSLFTYPLQAQQQSQSGSTSSDIQKPTAGTKNSQGPQKPEVTKGGQASGTTNDRIFEVLPNYGTVEDINALPPMSAGQKFKLATDGTFDYVTYPFVGLLAAISQAENSPKSWGQGWGAYGKRYGESFGDNGIGNYMTTAVFPTLLHQDPRYYQLGRRSFGRRAAYGIQRLFVTRSDAGQAEFNCSEICGSMVIAGISNLYHPPEERNLSRTFTTAGTNMLWDGVSNELKEFWPDIRRKFFRKQNP